MISHTWHPYKIHNICTVLYIVSTYLRHKKCFFVRRPICLVFSALEFRCDELNCELIKHFQERETGVVEVKHKSNIKPILGLLM